MNKKVLIEISRGHFFCRSVPDKGGQEFTLVDMNTNTYDSHSPCSTEDEILRAIKSCREWAEREGDRPVVRDLRVKQVGLTCFDK